MITTSLSNSAAWLLLMALCAGAFSYRFAIRYGEGIEVSGYRAHGAFLLMFLTMACGLFAATLVETAPVVLVPVAIGCAGLAAYFYTYVVRNYGVLPAGWDGLLSFSGVAAMIAAPTIAAWLTDVLNIRAGRVVIVCIVLFSITLALRHSFGRPPMTKLHAQTMLR